MAAPIPASLVGETWLEPLLVDLAFGPDEGFGVVIAGGDEIADVLDQLGHPVKDAPLRDSPLRIEIQIST